MGKSGEMTDFVCSSIGAALHFDLLVRLYADFLNLVTRFFGFIFTLNVSSIRVGITNPIIPSQLYKVTLLLKRLF